MEESKKSDDQSDGLCEEDKAREICVRACEFFLERVLMECPDALKRDEDLSLDQEEQKEKRRKRRSHLIESVARLWSLNEIGMEFSFSKEQIDTLIHCLVTGDVSAITSGQKRLHQFYEMTIATASYLAQEQSFATRVRLAALRMGEKNT